MRGGPAQNESDADRSRLRNLPPACPGGLPVSGGRASHLGGLALCDSVPRLGRIIRAAPRRCKGPAADDRAFCGKIAYLIAGDTCACHTLMMTMDASNRRPLEPPAGGRSRRPAAGRGRRLRAAPRRSRTAREARRRRRRARRAVREAQGGPAAAAEDQDPQRPPAPRSSRSPPTACSGAGSSRSASWCCSSSTRWATSSRCAARGSRRARRCSSPSWAPSSARARSATTRSPRRASASPGPVLGSLAAGRGRDRRRRHGQRRSSQALGYIGLLLNLFNLLPVVPLDGGRAMAAMAPWMWFVGFGALVVLDFVAPNPILLIITLFAAYELYRRWERAGSPTPEQAAYYRVSPRNRLARRRRLHRPDRRCSRSACTRPTCTARSPDAAQRRASRRPRSISRWESRRRSVSRLSCTSLPRASAISTFACGPEK